MNEQGVESELKSKLYLCGRESVSETRLPHLWRRACHQIGLGRLVGFEPTTSRTTIWRYYQLSYSRRRSSLIVSLSRRRQRSASSEAFP